MWRGEWYAVPHLAICSQLALNGGNHTASSPVVTVLIQVQPCSSSILKISAHDLHRDLPTSSHVTLKDCTDAAAACDTLHLGTEASQGPPSNMARAQARAR